MGIAEASPITMAPLLLRNLLTSLFGFADKFLISLSKKHKLLEVIHCLSVSFFLFFLRWLPPFFPTIHQVSDDRYPLKSPKGGSYGTSGSGSGSGDLGISRALTQLLSIISHVQISSRKYEVVRSLAEKLIDENHREGIEELREVNRAVLSTAFDRTIAQIEAAMLHQGFRNDDDEDEDGETSSGPVEFWLARVVRAVCSRLGSVKDGANRTGSSAEKLAAELLWLAGKMASCGCGIEACQRWASAAQLGRLSLSAEPRLQGSLVRVAAFMFKQSREMGKESEKHAQTKLQMLISWLPLLCRGSNGTDAPVLSIGERREVELVLGEMIGTLQRDEQEQVLAMWLHHFTYSASSDWPNLHASYAHWYSASRNLIIHQHH
ncbi:uncharacterized protein LOC111478071 [Cucurbita maxima]|uniref:Uncharacterized protein LOC111478071 n=1 Tax=Cucurbita maxima TaxID=3661 RepID=A0A6J1ISQ7_CUCMA|nr:uncharacterized protein LOC111478071 [Cucurbita maxima]